MDEFGIKGHLVIVMRVQFVRSRVHARSHAVVTLLPPGFFHTAEDEKENEGKRTYYRVYCADCSEEDVVDKLKNMFDVVFHQMATRVVVEIPFEEGSHVAETVTALRGFPMLHFTK